jgi:hypothetical protein
MSSRKIKFEEIETNPVISVSHVTQTDANLLERDEYPTDIIVDNLPHSYRILLEGISIPPEFSIAFKNVIEKTKKAGNYTWLVLDTDGPMVSELESFVW